MSTLLDAFENCQQAVQILALLEYCMFETRELGLNDKATMGMYFVMRHIQQLLAVGLEDMQAELKQHRATDKLPAKTLAA